MTNSESNRMSRGELELQKFLYQGTPEDDLWGLDSLSGENKYLEKALSESKSNPLLLTNMSGLDDQTVRYAVKNTPITTGNSNTSSIYLGFDRKLNKRVIVKKYGERHAKPQYTLLNEAQLTANIKHPNIAETLDVCADENSEIYMIQELIDGQDLKSLLKNSEFNIEQIPNLLKNISSAVGYLDEQGILHRDIKPANIMYEESSQRFKLVDLELASKDPTSLEYARTKDYAAPERITLAKADLSGEVYSIGSIIFEIVAWNKLPPNQAPSDGQGIHEFRNRFPKTFSVIEKATSKKPADRYQNTIEFYEEYAKAWETENSKTTEKTIQFISKLFSK